MLNICIDTVSQVKLYERFRGVLVIKYIILLLETVYIRRPQKTVKN